jgi:hypothetical protein
MLILRSVSRQPSPLQGCQIFLDTMYQKRGKVYQIATKLPNGHNICILFQIAKEYANLLHSKALKNLLMLVFLVWNYTYHLATLDSPVDRVNEPNMTNAGRSETHYISLHNWWWPRAGWPDEFAKKIARNVAEHIFVQNYVMYFFREKSGPKVWATSVIFKELSKVNNYPLCENSANMVTMVKSCSRFKYIQFRITR